MMSEVKIHIVRFLWAIKLQILVLNMADGLRKLEPLSFEGNVALNWKDFVQEVEIFINATHGDKNDKTKAYIFLNLAGREGIEKEKLFVYAPTVLNTDETIWVAAESRESIAILKQKFAEICDPWKGRHKFNTRILKEGEPFQSFIADHRRKGKEGKQALTFDRAIEIGVVNELSDRNNSKLSSKVTTLKEEEVHSLSKRRKTSAPSKPDINNCTNCGGDHAAKLQSCPAFGKKYLYCGKPTHFEKVCCSKRVGRGNRSIESSVVDSLWWRHINFTGYCKPWLQYQGPRSTFLSGGTNANASALAI